MPAKHQSESFWDFSVRTYRTEGVPDACLSLQNDYGADVNMLLYCCWVGANSGQFGTELFAQAKTFSTTWAEHVVVPLRRARTWMKQMGCTAEQIPTDDCMRLRDKIKSAEFAAEKLQQDVLESLLSSDERSDGDANKTSPDVMSNLHQYAEFAEIEVCDDVRQKFKIIIDAAFPS